MAITAKISTVFKKHRTFIILSAAFLVFLLVFPVIIGNSLSRGPARYVIRVGIDVLFFTAMGNAWNIIGGYGRQTSWASATFFAIGGYSSVLLYARYATISPLITMWLGVVLAMIVAVIIGLPCFRLRGVYFAIATIACTTIFRQLLVYFTEFTGGNLGIPIPNREESPINLIFRDFYLRPFYYIALVWMIITLGIVTFIERNRLGHYLRAICEDQDAAESLGINSTFVKLHAFMISAAMLSITGTFYAFLLNMVDPNTFASHNLSIRIALVAILGGMATKLGPLLGAVIIMPLFELSNIYLGRLGQGGASWALYGVLIVVIVLFRPSGLISLFPTIKANLEKRKAARNAPPAESQSGQQGGPRKAGG
jgi:branched-chain amino acid transport system permease protein